MKRVASAALALSALVALSLASLATAAPTNPDARANALLARPTLDHPQVRTITNATTTLRLDKAHDYLVRIDPSAVLTRPVSLVGGHNVVLEPGTLRYAPPAGAAPTWAVRGLLLKGQTGTAYVDGLVIHGPLNEGIDLDEREPRAVVVLHDITVDLVRGSKSGHHADLLQTWAGPDTLVVDGFSGASNYQGFFLKPNQQFRSGPRPSFFYLRNVDLDLRMGAYALWTDGHNAYPVYVHTTRIGVNPTRISRDEWLWPKPSTGDTTWNNVTKS